MIKVGKKWDQGAIYIGRGTPLGNPYRMYKEEERDIVCGAYEDWLVERIKAKDLSVIQELDKLLELAKQGDLVLGCFCAPRRCHGDTIKKYLDDRLNIDLKEK